MLVSVSRKDRCLSPKLVPISLLKSFIFLLGPSLVQLSNQDKPYDLRSRTLSLQKGVKCTRFSAQLTITIIIR